MLIFSTCFLAFRLNALSSTEERPNNSNKASAKASESSGLTTFPKLFAILPESPAPVTGGGNAIF